MVISTEVFCGKLDWREKRKRTEGEPPPSVRQNRSMNERQDNSRLSIVNTGVKRKCVSEDEHREASALVRRGET